MLNPVVTKNHNKSKTRPTIYIVTLTQE